MKGLLKFITCGSVDDGKPTLIGHMLYDAKLLYADQKQALELESKTGSQNGAIDYSLLLDGLMEEREQGITTDVAYRYFTTDNRSFIVADTHGLEEYTRNMAVGASFADLAVILIDASQGLLLQTFRYVRICALMGIENFVFAINKMDLVDYSEEVYTSIVQDIHTLVKEIGYKEMAVIPVSATEGDNITSFSHNMKWYTGKPLLEYLETVDINHDRNDKGFAMPVQRVCRSNRDFRGFQGNVVSGEVKTGDEIVVLPSGEKARVKTIYNMDKQVDAVHKGNAALLTLDKEVDVSRGCVIAKDTNLVTGNMFTAAMLWMDEKSLIPGKGYWLKLGTTLVPANVQKIKYKIDVNTGKHLVAKHGEKNEIIVCNLVTTTNIVYDVFSSNKTMSQFILIDRITHMISACGRIEHSLRRAENIKWHEMDITRKIRAEQMNQKPITIWFTGLSGSGKSTIANEVEKRLVMSGKHTMLLDGDNVRLGLNNNLGFTEEDRIENIRRVSEVAKLMNDAGLIVITSFITPFEMDRQKARENIGDENFVEIYVNTSLEECERRDTKGLYKKARNGEIDNFTGISSPYETPRAPEIMVNTVGCSIKETVDYVMEKLEEYL